MGYEISVSLFGERFFRNKLFEEVVCVFLGKFVFRNFFEKWIMVDCLRLFIFFYM